MIVRWKCVPIIVAIACLYLFTAVLAMSDVWPAQRAEAPPPYLPRVYRGAPAPPPQPGAQAFSPHADPAWPSREHARPAARPPMAHADPSGAQPVAAGADLALPPQERATVPFRAAHQPGGVIRIAAVGDIMMGREGVLPADGGAGIFREARPYLAGCDVVFGNLEGPLTDRGAPTKVFIPGLSYIFRTPPHYAAHLKEAGFTMLSLANNHINDYGWEGRLHTIETLNSLGIGHTGAVGQISVRNVNGRRVAFIGLAPNAACQDINDIPAAVALVQKAAATPGTLVVASFHGGAEGAAHMEMTGEISMYLGEKRGDLRRLSHALIDAGAALVLGHGPHVPKGLEVYKGRLIAYSLGNFATCAGISVQGPAGIAPLLLADLHPSGELADLRIVSFRQRYNQGPRLDAYEEAALTMFALSREMLAPEWAARLLPGNLNPRAALDEYQRLSGYHAQN